MRQKFKLGQRVKLSPAWYAWSKGGRPEKVATGVVVGLYALSPLTVKVRRDGYKTASTWHRDFWMPAAEGETRA